MNNNKSKQVLLAVVGLGVIIAGLTVVFFSFKKDASLTIQTSPLEVNIAIDGDDTYSKTNFKSGDTIRLNSGAVQIKASREGFKTKTLTYDVVADKTNKVFISLTPESDEAKQLLDSREEQYNRQYTATNAADNAAKIATEENEILQILPHYGRYFTISQGVSKQNPNKVGAMALYIDIYDPSGKSDALEFLRDSGYNPDDYEIIYTEHEYVPRGD